MLRFCLFIVVYLLFLSQSSAQKIYWSDITTEDRKEASAIIEKFSEYLKNSLYDSIPLLMHQGGVNLNGEYWLSEEELVRELGASLSDVTFVQQEIVGYTFEDFLDNYRESKVIKEIYNVFNNHSILFRLYYNSRGQLQPYYIILRENSSGEWRIYSLCRFPLSSEGNGIEVHEMPLEYIPMAGISIPLPAGFEMHEKKENQVDYYMEGETERDAVLQVMVDDIQAKLHFYTYKFVEYNNQNYDLSDLTVSYLPYGILYEYEVRDSYGTRNKGITVGLENDNRIILIQYYSFYDVYNEMEDRVDYIFRNLKVN